MSLISDALRRQMEDGDDDKKADDKKADGTKPVSGTPPAVAPAAPDPLADPPEGAKPLPPLPVIEKPAPAKKPIAPEGPKASPVEEATPKPAETPPPKASKGTAVRTAFGALIVLLLLLASLAFLAYFIYSELTNRPHRTAPVEAPVVTMDPGPESGLDDPPPAVPGTEDPSSGAPTSVDVPADDTPDATVRSLDPALGEAPAASPLDLPPEPWPQLTLGGIVGGRTSGAAILNGEVIGQDELILDVLLVDIQKGGVVLEYRGERRFLKIGATITD